MVLILQRLIIYFRVYHLAIVLEPLIAKGYEISSAGIIVIFLDTTKISGESQPEKISNNFSNELLMSNEI